MIVNWLYIFVWNEGVEGNRGPKFKSGLNPVK